MVRSPFPVLCFPGLLLACAAPSSQSDESGQEPWVEALPVAEHDDHLSSHLAHLDLEVRFSEDGVEVGERGLRLSWPGNGQPRPGPCRSQRNDPVQCGRAVEVPVDSGTLWWLGKPSELRWGWTLDRPSEDFGESIELVLDVAGTRSMQAESSRVRLVDQGGTAWTISAPVAWDADGRGLAVSQSVDADRLVVTVEPGDARWPITVDPALTTASTTILHGTTSSYGVALWGGDVNADGYDDMVIGDRNIRGAYSSGAVYLHLGSASGPSTVADMDFDWTGSPQRIESVVRAGDQNQDGYADLLVAGHGRAYSGLGLQFSGVMKLYTGHASGLASTPVWVASGGAHFGEGIGAQGDINGDGYDDLASGTGYVYSWEPHLSGRLDLFYGSSTGPSATADVTLTGASRAAPIGHRLELGADLNGDGYDDIVNGYSTIDVYNGGPTGPSTAYDFRISRPSGSGFYSMTGPYASAGDVDGDGFEDLLVGDFGYNYSGTGAGAVWLFYGAATGTTSDATPVVVGDHPRDWLGGSLATGDVDGDGALDLVAGGTASRTHGGVVGLVPGTDLLTGGYDLSDLDSVWEGDTVRNYVEGVDAAGDGNGDGYADVLVTWRGSHSSTGSTVQQLEVYLGHQDKDGDGVIVGATGTQDCDDEDASVGGPTDWYDDDDGDGLGDAYAATACTAPSGTVATSTDCDDTDASIGEPTEQYVDSDGDGYGSTSTDFFCPADSGWSTDNTDCNDRSASVNPGATEVCDRLGTDEDCDGLVNDDDSSTDTSTMSTYWADTDGDGYGDAASPTLLCGRSSTTSDNDDDCDDTDASIRPYISEKCDALDVDENCNGLSDDDDVYVSSSTTSTFYADTDGDGYGDSAVTDDRCDEGSGYIADNTDCDDTRADVYPGATEVCDASDADEDCDGLADDADSSVDSTTFTAFYADTDGDGYGDAASTRSSCDDGSGYVADSTDCDDTRADVSPAADEVCDAADVDEDCDGTADDADSSVDTSTYGAFFADSDGDGFGDALTWRNSCDESSGYIADNTDCDDTLAHVYPGATEVCDADDIDEDCNGLADDDDPGADWSSRTIRYRDDDGDGYGNPDGTTVASCEPRPGMVDNDGDCDDTNAAISPAATEACDSDDVDEDCDGLSDDDDPSVDPSTVTRTYADTDGDLYGDPDAPLDSCEVPSGYVHSPTDCDDTRADRNPGETEVCDDEDLDEDCDELADDDDDDVDPSSQTTWYADTDGDGFGDPDSSLLACSQPDGFLTDATDCDDDDARSFPGAPEEDCDGIDHNCDGEALFPEDCVVDSGTPDDAGTDLDRDGAGAPKTGCSVGGTSGGLAVWLGGLALVGRRRSTRCLTLPSSEAPSGR